MQTIFPIQPEGGSCGEVFGCVCGW
ncbi:hypothetical protein E2C01_091936 [Portunus trituberculatus]|uniref:Uncharacterized protein n=1 Tax=Portunus trituberculatus TaxID=210409 RepID=A0A5B7JQ18_PORTR|nr:hypothetical protein [Portunus trituberculatus]